MNFPDRDRNAMRTTADSHKERPGFGAGHSAAWDLNHYEEAALSGHKVRDIVRERDFDLHKKFSMMDDATKRSYLFQSSDTGDYQTKRRSKYSRGSVGENLPSFSSRHYNLNSMAKDEGLATNSELNLKIRELAKERNDIMRDIQERGGKMATAGIFLGYISNSLIQPETYVPVFGWKNAGSVIKAGMKVAGESMVIQGGLEPIIHKLKDDLGVEYTVDESINNIMMAGALGLGLGAGIRKLGNMYRERGNKEAAEILDKLMDDMETNPAHMTVLDDGTVAITDEDLLKNIKMLNEAQEKLEVNKAGELPVDEGRDSSDPSWANEKLERIKKEAEAEAEVVNSESPKLDLDDIDYEANFDKTNAGKRECKENGTCMPYALSIFNGDFEGNVRAARAYGSGSKGGVYEGEVLYYANDIGITLSKVDLNFKTGKRTMNVNSFIERNPKGKYIIIYKSHVIMVKDGQVFDSAFMKFKGGQKKVLTVYSVDSVKNPFFKTDKGKGKGKAGVKKKEAKKGENKDTAEDNSVKIDDRIKTLDKGGVEISLKDELDDVDVEMETFEALKDCL